MHRVFKEIERAREREREREREKERRKKNQALLQQTLIQFGLKRKPTNNTYVRNGRPHQHSNSPQEKALASYRNLNADTDIHGTMALIG